MEAITKVQAIRRFFDMTAKQAMDEVKDLMQNDRPAYEWMAGECAKALGVELREAK